MNDNSPDVFISEIDRERFGVKTARVVGLTRDQLTSILDFCARENIQLLIARCNMSDLATAQSLEQQGFLLMDTLVYYKRDLTGQPVPSGNGFVHFRPIRNGEEEDVRLVAVESFRGYFGHYHADQRLDRNKCDEVYVDWAVKACASRGADGNFLVAEIEKRIVAFGVFRMNNPEEGELFLGGIHPEFQGKGIYHSFLCKAMGWCLSQSARRLVISTQINNIAVQKVLGKFGFEISKGYYTFHKWFD